MTTRERIKAEIDNLSEEHLNELLSVIQRIAQAKAQPTGQKQSLLSKLRQVKIDAPEDFAANLDLYLVERSALAAAKTFVDTLFVIALINQRDQYHEQALKIAEQYEGRPLLTTDAVLLEIGNALARGYKTEAVTVIENFLTSEDVEVIRLTPNLFAEAFALYKSHQDKEWA